MDDYDGTRISTTTVLVALVGEFVNGLKIKIQAEARMLQTFEPRLENMSGQAIGMGVIPKTDYINYPTVRF